KLLTCFSRRTPLLRSPDSSRALRFHLDSPGAGARRSSQPGWQTNWWHSAGPWTRVGSAARGVLNRLFLDGRKSRCRVGVPQPDSLRARDYSEFLPGCKPSGSSKRRTNVPATCCLLPKAVQADVRQSSDQCGHGVHGGFFRSAWCSRCSRLRWKKVRDPENYTSKQVGSQPGHEI